MFLADAVPENAAHIEDLLHAPPRPDAQVRRGAAQAQYAGEPDPYRARPTTPTTTPTTADDAEADSRRR